MKDKGAAFMQFDLDGIQQIPNLHNPRTEEEQRIIN